MNRQQRRKMEKEQKKKGSQIKVTNPIDGLEKYGYNIQKDSNGKIEVWVDKSYNLLEGSLVWNRDKTFNSESKNYFIDKNQIKNYNSLWELTKSGWDSEDEMVYPYINLNGEWVRWDNQRMREDGGFYKWDNQNQSKYIKTLLTQQNKESVQI